MLKNEWLTTFGSSSLYVYFSEHPSSYYDNWGYKNQRNPLPKLNAQLTLVSQTRKNPADKPLILENDV